MKSIFSEPVMTEIITENLRVVIEAFPNVEHY